MTRVSYWWMRTNLTLKMMKLDDMCFLRHSYLHIVIHSGICWSVWRVLFWHAGIEDNSWNYNYDVYTVQYDDKFWSGNTVKGIQAQQGWNFVGILNSCCSWKNVCWNVLLSAASTEVGVSKLVVSSSLHPGTEYGLIFSSYLGPPHPLVRGE